MNNEMKFEKNGLLIPNGALEKLGLSGISLSAWLGQDHILLMPQEMTALQLLHALEGLSRASVELLGVLQAACRRPCAAGCEKNMGTALMQENAAVVTDGRLITGTSAGCAVSFGLALVEALKGKEAAETVRKQIVIR